MVPHIPHYHPIAYLTSFGTNSNPLNYGRSLNSEIQNMFVLNFVIIVQIHSIRS